MGDDMILDYKGKQPKIGKNVFIAPTAVVIGRVHIMDNVNIWYGTVVRGDRDTITIPTFRITVPCTSIRDTRW
jgi:carbonic anhydrase/acetyltransferase-like protein (isoleucine patch superfamily)